jgi:hypothetical protein
MMNDAAGKRSTVSYQEMRKRIIGRFPPLQVQIVPIFSSDEGQTQDRSALDKIQASYIRHFFRRK